MGFFWFRFEEALLVMVRGLEGSSCFESVVYLGWEVSCWRIEVGWVIGRAFFFF